METEMNIKFYTINGLKQKPKCLDFHITPVLTFGRAPSSELNHVASGWALFLEWGHWAVGFLTYKTK